MKIIEDIVKEIEKYIWEKNILEIGCGNADLSLACCKFAEKVFATDISLYRPSKIVELPDNLEIVRMDAQDIELVDYHIDTIIAVNALGHMNGIIPDVLSSCLRKLAKGGNLLIISSWKLDNRVLNDEVIPHLASKGYRYNLIEKSRYKYIVVTK